MFTPIEKPANRLKIAEASTQVSTTAGVFLPQRCAAFFIPANAVRNICSSISELYTGICLEFSLSLSRGSVYLLQLSSVCQGSNHRVDIAGAQVRSPSPKLSPPLLENQLPARPQHQQGTLMCHNIRLPLAPPSGSTVVPFPSQGKRPGRARSHFTLLFTTCQSTYQSQLHLRICLLDLIFLPGKGVAQHCCQVYVLLSFPIAAEYYGLFHIRLFITALFCVFQSVLESTWFE